MVILESVQTSFEFSGGALCLDFVNTLGDRPIGRSEKLQAPEDLERWAREAGVLTGSAPPLSPRFLARAVELRERLFRIFAGISASTPAPAEDLEALNRELASALGHLQLESAAPGEFAWTFREHDGPERLLWPIVRSAAELLTSSEAAEIKVCASETCSWLFVDRSRTHRRRWCDMKSCGNRAKARRHYRRIREHAR